MRTTSKSLGEVFFSLCKAVDTGISLGAWLRYKHGEIRDLVSLDIDPLWYNSADEFHLDYIVVTFLSKNKEVRTGIDLRAVALQKFKTSEEVCRITNARFRTRTPTTSVMEAHGHILFGAARKIAGILGPLDLEKIYLHCRWGPGATFDLRRDNAGVDLKQSVVPSVTYGALPFARAVLEYDHHWFATLSGVFPDGPFCVLNEAFRVVPGNRVVTVPKNAKGDRTIAAEPSMNSYIQQGVGRYIRRRLMRSGIDLSNQKINQNWASLSNFFDLATVDLSAASDTIARELVFTLLPPDWAAFLDSLRSKCYLLDGEWHPYEKFSSMGNAFTFELETLIFYCLISTIEEQASGRSLFSSAYGDDLIVRQSDFPLVKEVLEYCGFSVNTEKSFHSGQFFESCGKHYFGGFDVTPIYQKEILSGTEFIRCGNRVLRLMHRLTGGVGFDSRLRTVWLSLRRTAPSELSRFQLPFGVDADDGWLTPASEFSGASYTPGLGWHCRVYSWHRRYRRARQDGLFALSLRSAFVAHELGYDLGYEVACTLVKCGLPHFARFDTSGVAPRIELEPTRIKPSRRWVTPTRDFDANWI